MKRWLKLGDNIVYQETVSTGRRSAVDIRLIDESTLIMGENSEMILDRMVYNPNRGVVGMSCNSGDPDSAESQFFITLGRAESLDGNYTVIGKLIEGLEVLDTLKTGRPPKNPDRIIRLKIGSASKK